MTRDESLDDRVDVLVCSPIQSFSSKIKSLLKGFSYRPTWINSVDNLLDTENVDKIFEKNFGEEELFNPHLAIIEAQENTQLTSEWVQAFKMNYPHVPAIVLYNSNTPIDHKVVIKNGAARCMHYPYDAEYFTDVALNLAPVELNDDSLPYPALVPVDLEDFEANTMIPCSMYLRLSNNEKMLCLRKKNNIVDDRILEKFLNTSNHRVYIKKTELQKFFEYAREVLKMRESKETISTTERFQSTKDKIQKLISHCLDFSETDYDEGKKRLNDCETILKDLRIDDQLNETRIKQILPSHLGHDKTIYNDAINVCVYSALFAKLCRFDIEKIQEVAIAGLLHNIGISSLSPDLVTKNESDHSEEEWENYKIFPIKAILLIKNRKVPLLEGSSKSIEQAWERIDGSGFPKGLSGKAVSQLSRILHIAIEFNRLTQQDIDGKFLSPREAVEKLIELNQLNSQLDLRKLNLIYAFFRKHYKIEGEKDLFDKLVG